MFLYSADSFVMQIILECTTTADLQLTESLVNMN